MNYRVMRYAIEQAEVEGAAWQTLVVLAYRADRETGRCFISRRRLAREARISTSTVHFALEELLKGGYIAVLLTGAGRRSTEYQLLLPTLPSDSVTDSQRSGSLDSVTEPLADPVVTRFSGSSDSIHGPVVTRSPNTLIRKEGKNGRDMKVAGSDAPPDGVAAGYEVPSTTDPTAVVDEAVLAVDPDALRDPDGWNLSDAFGRAWLPNEDVAGWLRRYRKAASA